MSRKVKFNSEDDKVYMMIEGEKDNQEEWKREIISSESDIDTYFSGKICLGERRIDTVDIINVVLGEFPNLVINKLEGLKLRTVLIDTYPMIKQKRTLIKYLNKHIGVDNVGKALLKLEKNRQGNVCVIHKDSRPISFNTRALRAHNIQKGFKYAIGSSDAQGIVNYNKLLRGESIVLVSGEFATKILAETDYLKICTDISGQYSIKLDIFEIHKLRAGIVYEYHKDDIRKVDPFTKVREKTIFWLRWNSWKKFEKIIVENTDLENHPTEWDSGYGVYWRQVNGKEKRFEEVYEKYDVDKLLKIAEDEANKKK